MRTETTATDVDGARLDALIEEQERAFLARQSGSAEMAKRAVRSLAGGVTSSWQLARPQVFWISHGSGSKVYDLDGTEYVDLNGGYGVDLVGHGHPAVVRAIAERARRGTHFAQPTEDAVVVAEALAERWGLPLWRFSNSGTEATMDAVHMMRAITGRDRIIKVEGCYHGHHDSVMVSVANEAAEIGPRGHPANPPSGAGLPRAITDLVVSVPYNDLGAVERAFDEHPDGIAGMILEPIMMNAGIIPPEAGYLAGLVEVCHRHGALLTFDEVKTGLTAGPGGATKLTGVTPDIVCMAKALGGGVPCGAIGGTANVMRHIVDGSYEQVGTFNGNPLTMAAARAVLCEVLDDAAYAHIAELRIRMCQGIERVIAEFELPAHVVAVGAKGCVTFSTERMREYRDFLELDDRFSHLHWLFQHNGGVFLPPWGKAEQWLLSVQHEPADVDRFLRNFRAFAVALRA